MSDENELLTGDKEHDAYDVKNIPYVTDVCHKFQKYV